MKKLYVLGVALLAFAACKNGGTEEKNAVRDSMNVKTACDIAYVRLDSLLPNYDRYVDMAAEFEALATKTQNDLAARGRRLQNEAAKLQENAQNMLITRSDATKAQEELERKAMNLETARQTKMAELAEKEQVMTNQVMHAITQYVAKFNKDGRFKMVLSTSGGTPILNADPQLDITAEILDGLNREYAAEKKKEKK